MIIFLRNDLFVGYDALCIQHSFTTLRKELPEIDHSKLMVESVLDDSDISDINGCDHAIRQKSKLIKIILKKGENACNTLLRAIHEQLKRDDLIRKMISKNDYIKRRGNVHVTYTTIFNSVFILGTKVTYNLNF